MDLRKDIDYVMNHKLGLDDTFQFRCKGCGKCCTHREDVLLTAYDLFRIARYFGRSPAEILSRYCESYIGGRSHLPVVRIKPVPPDNACPFLRNKRCMVHKDKPVVCASFPLGRVYQPGEKSPYFVLQPDVDCGGEPRTVTVRDWLGHLSGEESERAGLLWGDITTTVTRTFMDSWDQLTEEKQDNVFQCLLTLLYLLYDVREPFLPQFEANALKAFLYLRTVVALPDIPEWLPLKELQEGTAQHGLLLLKAYGMYKRDWAVQHNIPLASAYMNPKADNGSTQADLCVFEREFFSDPAYMKNLLCSDDFTIWRRYMAEEEKETNDSTNLALEKVV